MVKRSRDLVDGISLPRITTLPSLAGIEKVLLRCKYKVLYLSRHNVVEMPRKLVCGNSTSVTTMPSLVVLGLMVREM